MTFYKTVFCEVIYILQQTKRGCRTAREIVTEHLSEYYKGIEFEA